MKNVSENGCRFWLILHFLKWNVVEFRLVGCGFPVYRSEHLCQNFLPFYRDLLISWRNVTNITCVWNILSGQVIAQILQMYLIETQNCLQLTVYTHFCWNSVDWLSHYLYSYKRLLIYVCFSIIFMTDTIA